MKSLNFCLLIHQILSRARDSISRLDGRSVGPSLIARSTRLIAIGLVTIMRAFQRPMNYANYLDVIFEFADFLIAFEGRGVDYFLHPITTGFSICDFVVLLHDFSQRRIVSILKILNRINLSFKKVGNINPIWAIKNDYTFFFISKCFISNLRLKSQKI